MALDSTRWSAYAGVYAFLCGVVLLLPLGVIADTLVKTYDLPTGFVALHVPGSGAIIGTVVWWAVVDHRLEYTYLIGGVVGLLTAHFTVLVWAHLVAIVYGPRAVLVSGVVVVFAIVVAAPVSFNAGLPMLYARLAGGQSGGKEPAV